MALLVASRPGGGALAFEVREGETTIGRGALATVRLESPFVSRTHACLRATPDGYVLVDTDSKNGTYVAGRRLAGEMALRPGDTFTIGDWHCVLYLDSSAEATMTMEALGRTWLDDDSRTLVVMGAAAATFTVQEFRAFRTLWDHSGAVCSHADLGAAVWGSHVVGKSDLPAYTANMVHRLIHRLRAKLAEHESAHGLRVVNVPFAGYRLERREDRGETGP